MKEKEIKEEHGCQERNMDIVGSLVKHLNQRTCLRNIKKDYSK